jgi:PAN domain
MLKILNCIRMLTLSLTVVCLIAIGSTLSFAQPAYAQAALPFEFGVDRPGRDYKSFDIPPAPAGEFDLSDHNCQASCEADPKCRAWTFVRAGVQGSNGRCWLKSSIPSATKNVNCTSGVMQRAFEPGVDRPGLDYQNFELPLSSGPNACKSSCEGDAKCQAWTYVKAGIQSASPKCWLKTAVPQATENSCCTSGVVSRPPVIH